MLSDCFITKHNVIWLNGNALLLTKKCFMLFCICLVVLPGPFRGMRAWMRHNSRLTPQGLDQKSRMAEAVPKMARRRVSDAEKSRRRWARHADGVHGRIGSQKDPKHPRRTLAGETSEPRRRGQWPTRNRLEKGPIESGMIPDGSNTTPGHAPVQGT